MAKNNTPKCIRSFATGLRLNSVVGFLAISVVSIMGLLFLLNPHVSAVCPTPYDPAHPYQVDICSLPQTTAGPDKITAITTIVFTIIGAISLLMITIGGFRYIISEGDPQGVSKAKGTIIFALIGLLVSISAVSIVTFVIGRT